MNKVILVGRLTADPEIRYSTGENATAVARFSVAVNRSFKNADGAYDADFPRVNAFGKTAEFINQYFHKGDMIGITGRITTGSYTNKEGQKVYTTDVTAENVEFVGGKGNGNAAPTPQKTQTRSSAPNNDFMNIPENTDEEALPF